MSDRHDFHLRSTEDSFSDVFLVVRTLLLPHLQELLFNNLDVIKQWGHRKAGCLENKLHISQGEPWPLAASATAPELAVGCCPVTGLPNAGSISEGRAQCIFPAESGLVRQLSFLSQ